MRVILTVASLAIFTAASAVVAAGDDALSIRDLLAQPERYAGKPVVVKAYATVKFEGDTLCTSRAPANRAECIWLTYYDGPWQSEADLARYRAAEKSWKRFNGKQVLVHGTFSRENTGHWGAFPGALEHITAVILAP